MDKIVVVMENRNTKDRRTVRLSFKTNNDMMYAQYFVDTLNAGDVMTASIVAIEHL